MCVFRVLFVEKFVNKSIVEKFKELVKLNVMEFDIDEIDDDMVNIFI